MNPLSLILALAAAATAVIWQHAAALEIWHTWNQRPEYSHGMLLPVLALGILWYRRTELGRTAGRGSWAGLALFALGAALAWLGNLASLFVISQYGLAIMLCGVLLAWLGPRAARRHWVVFALLFLAVPPPNFILNSLSFDMQLLSSKLAVQLAQPFGVSVFVEGNVIDLGGLQLQVAEACDGLRYLFPLVTIGFLMAYFFDAPWWKRVAIFLVSLPLAIAMNALRVGLIILMVERWGLKMAEGFFHDLQGWFMFVLSTLILYFIATLITGKGARLSAPAPMIDGEPALAPRPRVHASLATSAALSAVVCVLGLATPARVDAVPTRAHLSELPMQAGAWQGARGALERAYLDVLKLDDYLLADFTADGRGPVNLYVAWYQSQRSGASAHSPRSCIPGGGWSIRSIDEVRIAGAGGQAFAANRVLIERGLQRQLVYYWFEQRGRMVTNEYLVKWYIFWDALTRNRTDGAMVRIAAVVPEGKTVEEVDAMLVGFAGEMVPRLAPYLPG